MAHSYIFFRPDPGFPIEALKNDAWQPRPRQTMWDKNPNAILHAVGFSLTGWECIEGELAIIYAQIVATKPSFDDKYYKAANFNRKMELLSDAININIYDVELNDLKEFISTIALYAVRRNEIAHGRALHIADGGFIFLPNTSMSRHWPEGTASFQWRHEDILHYATAFFQLACIAETIRNRIVAALKISNDV